MRYLTAGESHGRCLTAILEGLPAGLRLNLEKINSELKRRQSGYGRGARMKIEKDKVQEFDQFIKWAQTMLDVYQDDVDYWRHKVDSMRNDVYKCRHGHPPAGKTCAQVWQDWYAANDFLRFARTRLNRAEGQLDQAQNTLAEAQNDLANVNRTLSTKVQQLANVQGQIAQITSEMGDYDWLQSQWTKYNDLVKEYENKASASSDEINAAAAAADAAAHAAADAYQELQDIQDQWQELLDHYT